MTCSTLLSTTGTTRSKEKSGENFVIIITALGYKTSKDRQGNKGMLYVLGTN